MTKRLFVIAPPPTPNGGLHIGHLSGPYLGGDIFSRIQAKRFDEVHYCVSTDDNQTYVDTTAKRLGLSTQDLLDDARREIKDTFSKYDINLSLFGTQDKEYKPYILDFYKKLISSGKISIEDVDVFYDESAKSFPVESFVSGVCSNCLVETCGGICENCGFPNDGCNLLNLDTTNLTVVSDARLVIDLEQYRSKLEAFFASLYMRPELEHFVSTMLAKKLPKVPLSYKLDRGINIDHLGLKDQVLNVWAEMYPGHHYFLDQSSPSYSSDKDKYVQFFGFDNSFFYAFLHKALYFAGIEAGVNLLDVSEMYTNQFYFLENDKFSTSKGHAIWANDLAIEYNTDLIKIYLALYGPEFEEGTFNKEHFEKEANKITDLINSIANKYNELIPNAGVYQNPTNTNKKLTLTTPNIYQFSTRRLSRESISKLNFVRSSIEDSPELIEHIPTLLIELLYPFTTQYCSQIQCLIEDSNNQESPLILPLIEFKL